MTYADYQHFVRQGRRIDATAARLQALRAERETDVANLLAHLGIRVVHPALTHSALDVLRNIDPTPDGHWIWTAKVNGHGSPVCYVYGPDGERHYRGAATVVHEAVTGTQHQGCYHARCDADRCLLPAHRCKVCDPTSA